VPPPLVLVLIVVLIVVLISVLISVPIVRDFLFSVWHYIPHRDSESHAEWVTAYATIGLCVIAIAAAVFAWYQVMQLRRQNEQSRHVERSQTFLEISRQWNDPEGRKNRINIREIYYGAGHAVHLKDELLRMAKSDNPDEVARYWQCMETVNFFQYVAVLVDDGSIAFDTICRAWGFVIWDYWTMLHKFVEYERGVPPKDKEYGKAFGKLADDIATKKNFPRPWADDSSVQDVQTAGKLK
jgi:hypothetical protein